MKRDLLFLVDRVLPMLDEHWLEVVARNRGIRKTKDGESLLKLLSAYVHKTEENELGRLLVEMVILQTVQKQGSPAKALQEAAQHTRWTRTPSPSRSGRSLPRRRRRKRQRRPWRRYHPSQHRRQKRPNLQSVSSGAG